MNATEIVVGTDGSPASHSALRWAVHEAHLSGSSLRILHAHDSFRAAGAPPTRRFRAEQVLADALAVVHELHPDVTVSAGAIPGNPVSVLLNASKDAVLVVVGTRGRGSVTGRLLGSVSQEVAERAISPVVVVHEGVPHEGPIVVGVDDSPAAEEAVGLAFELADSRRADLVAVRTHPAANPDPGSLPALERVLAPWRDKYPEVHAEALVVGGRPSPFLLGAAHAASLVVVGRSGFPWSVDTRLVCHAACPVIVVPEPAAW